MQPGLLEIARKNLDRWQDQAGRSRPYLEEWRRILNLPQEEMLSLMGQDDARMTELRQSSPFAGILEPAERWAIYARFESARFESNGEPDAVRGKTCRVNSWNM
jgi:hypothetical protein